MKKGVLIGVLLVSLIDCTQTITCNPDLGPTGAGCPASHPICDPNGICRQKCDTTSCTDPNTICDVSGTATNIGVTQICQTKCNTVSDCPAINGWTQACHPYQAALPANAPAGTTPVQIQMCKRLCPSIGAGEQPAWCPAQYYSCTIGLPACTPKTS